MSTTSLHTLYAVNTPAGLVDQVSRYDHDLGIEQVLEAGDGKVDPEYAATITQQPTLGFATTALAKALTAAGFGGLAINSATEWFFRKYESGGTRATGSNHVKLSASNGILLPRTASASQGQVAEIDYQMLPTSSDGVSAAFSVATGQSLAGSPTENEKFTIGPVEVNGTLLGGETDVNVDFGLQEIIDASSGDPLPTFAAIQTRQPTIQVTTTDILTLNDLTTTESASTHYGQEEIVGTTQVSFWKLDKGGIRRPKGNSEHVVITLPAGRVVVDTVTVDGNTPAGTQITLTPIDDGNNQPLSVATAAALPS